MSLIVNKSDIGKDIKNINGYMNCFPGNNESIINYYLSNNKMPKKQKRVVIIGAGFAGLTAQRTICEYGDEFDVTVIDMKNYFEYTPGILRSFVNPKHITRLTGKIPSKRNKFIFGEVIGFKRGEPTGEVTVKLIDKSTGATKRTKMQNNRRSNKRQQRMMERFRARQSRRPTTTHKEKSEKKTKVPGDQKPQPP